MDKIACVDLGDTLVAFEPRRYQLIYDFLRDNGYNLSLSKVYRAYVRSLSKFNFPDDNGVNPFDVKDFLYELGLDPSNEKLTKKISSISRGSEYHIYDDAIDFLEYLRSEGYKTALVSNATPRARNVVYSLGLHKYLDILIFSFEVGVVKPNPKIFTYVREKLGEPDFHLGDIAEMDIQGAKRATLKRGILLDRFGFYGTDIKTLKDVIRSLEALR
ncbi:HAD family hydrolase [Sulfolobus acidocaldarius]|uniref:Haloacid dehalogenase-like hydrolase n=4 Tax=Sulfolobus acidocaldarius TaxID=2285 RepID=Q4JC23_SULAC|nr:HAD-IA family hydrolase [Sulfolobus acidocaldarius]AAY79656.1 haloacid dehalogenase-like hydrolase [Sulfolobus acidocaldarius DSM 639]AGE70213.1 haloacid dehalogenase-like hydrolase [Sulfolobus acidocaldarius N8]AGE72488.1 haloacid dehalogenase-like hydrolase [Sulfolobus acidocaldarius Ron12/I]ALU29378.1 haloacid dehalogenase [Sulfolobus acidocaldarius]ALU32107.1 haloacid dehalogenase [Sulfolobus acidocaldarius]